MADTMTRPMGVLESDALRAFRAECDEWLEHQRVCNALADVQRRAQMGISTPGDDVLHRDLMNQLDVIETAIAAHEAEQGAEMDARLQSWVASLQREMEARVAARDRERLTANVLRGVA